MRMKLLHSYTSTPIPSINYYSINNNKNNNNTSLISNLSFGFSTNSSSLRFNSSSKFLVSPSRPRLFFSACAQAGAAGSESDPVVNKVSEFRDAFWRFLRPHTIRGTALGSFALVARALLENPNIIRWSLVLKAFSGLVALICGNGYIVGINQIYDIGIDKYAIVIVTVYFVSSYF